MREFPPMDKILFVEENLNKGWTSARGAFAWSAIYTLSKAYGSDRIILIDVVPLSYINRFCTIKRKIETDFTHISKQLKSMKILAFTARQPTNYELMRIIRNLERMGILSKNDHIILFSTTLAGKNLVLLASILKTLGFRNIEIYKYIYTYINQSKIRQLNTFLSFSKLPITLVLSSSKLIKCIQPVYKPRFRVRYLPLCIDILFPAQVNEIILPRRNYLLIFGQQRNMRLGYSLSIFAHLLRKNPELLLRLVGRSGDAKFITLFLKKIMRTPKFAYLLPRIAFLTNILTRREIIEIIGRARLSVLLYRSPEKVSLPPISAIESLMLGVPVITNHADEVLSELLSEYNLSLDFTHVFNSEEREKLYKLSEHALNLANDHSLQKSVACKIRSKYGVDRATTYASKLFK